MKRIPTAEMDVIITGDERVISRCALGQREEPLFPSLSSRIERMAKLNQAIDEFDAATEREKEFAFVEGDGTLIRIGELTEAEARMANIVLERVGSDRRWMEIE